jgi:hypothetical protein
VKNKVDVHFKRQIQQIVFPGSESLEELGGKMLTYRLKLDFFVVRTMSEVAILSCTRTDEKRPSIQLCISISLSSLNSSTSKYIADTVFNHSGSHIAVITDNGYWTVFKVSLRRQDAVIVSSGSTDLPFLDIKEVRTGWWKLEWAISGDSLVVAESKGLHLVNVTVLRSEMKLTQTGLSRMVLTPSTRDHFCGLVVIGGLGGTVVAVLTTSEILIVDSTEWKLLLRQKHRRDRDPSLLMKLYSSQDGIYFPTMLTQSRIYSSTHV